LKSNRVDIDANNDFLEISVYPLSGQGHDFSFIIDINNGKLTNLVVGEIAPQPDIDEPSEK